MTRDPQLHIINTLGVKPTINVDGELRLRVDFLKSFLKQTNAKGYVLGISGGQDSALAGKLAQIAINELNNDALGSVPNLWEKFNLPEDKPYRFVALLLPYGTQKDAEDARVIAEEFINADKVETFNIQPAVDAFTDTFNSVEAIPLADYHKGNVKARMRMVTQYAYAGQENLLVIGTDHAAEAVTGFYTKHGDGAVDLVPLAGLNKRQGKALLKALDAPEFVINKKPTADLLDNAPSQADETELGLTYDVLDDYLEGRQVSDEDAAKIENRYFATEHKRQMPVSMFDLWWV